MKKLLCFVNYAFRKKFYFRLQVMKNTKYWINTLNYITKQVLATFVLCKNLDQVFPKGGEKKQGFKKLLRWTYIRYSRIVDGEQKQMF